MIDPIHQGKMEICMREILELLGEDPTREGLQETPRRVISAWSEMTSGSAEDPVQHLSKTFTAPSNDMVIVEGIPFVSLCEHHLSPFVGRCHVGYIPGWCEGGYRIVGLSKFARLVDGFARRLQVQEVLTDQIASAIDESLKPEDCIIVVKAQHTCMSLRGAKADGSLTTTSAVRGLFTNNTDGVKSEFFDLLRLQVGTKG